MFLFLFFNFFPKPKPASARVQDDVLLLDIAPVGKEVVVKKEARVDVVRAGSIQLVRTKEAKMNFVSLKFPDSPELCVRSVEANELKKTLVKVLAAKGIDVAKPDVSAEDGSSFSDLVMVKDSEMDSVMESESEYSLVKGLVMTLG